MRLEIVTGIRIEMAVFVSSLIPESVATAKQTLEGFSTIKPLPCTVSSLKQKLRKLFQLEIKELYLAD